MPLELEPLSPAVGVLVSGIDLRGETASATRQAVVDAYWKSHLLLVRDQALTLDEQVRFASWVGPIQPPAGSYQPEGADRIETYMSNVKGSYVERGVVVTGEFLAHRDDTHRDSPAASMCLHAEEVSSVGGETIFVDTEAAYEALSPETRDRIAGLTAVHLGPAAPSDSDFDSEQLGIGFRSTGGSPENRLFHRWPVVREHPVTRRPVLYIDAAAFYGFDGVDPDEGDDLWKILLSALEDPAIAYRHTWQVGDTILWDNMSLLHARTAFPDTERRTLRKLLIGEFSQRSPELVNA